MSMDPVHMKSAIWRREQILMTPRRDKGTQGSRKEESGCWSQKTFELLRTNCDSQKAINLSGPPFLMHNMRETDAPI